MIISVATSQIEKKKEIKKIKKNKKTHGHDIHMCEVNFVNPSIFTRNLCRVYPNFQRKREYVFFQCSSTKTSLLPLENGGRREMPYISVVG
jgi:hypothetical protein